jgi:hypothetical protein
MHLLTGVLSKARVAEVLVQNCVTESRICSGASSQGEAAGNRVGPHHSSCPTCVATQAKAQADITAEAIALLSQPGRVAQPFVADRVVDAASMTGSGESQEEVLKVVAANPCTESASIKRSSP